MTRRVTAAEVAVGDRVQLDDGGWGAVTAVNHSPGAEGADRLVLAYRRPADPPGEDRTLRLWPEDTLMVGDPPV
jgi:hypothetical protein